MDLIYHNDCFENPFRLEGKLNSRDVRIYWRIEGIRVMNSSRTHSSISENHMGDEEESHLRNYEGELYKRGSHELEMDLAYFHFDLLFIQTQIEASGPEYQNSTSARNAAERRVFRLYRKIEAVKKELYRRSNTR
jgi:hypothetical protein